MKDKMDKAGSLHAGNKKCAQGFGWLISLET